MFEKFAEDVMTRCLEKLAFIANKYNFAHGTSSLFSRTKKRPDRKPDKLSPKKGSDSEYWITQSGVIRGSDHWGAVGSCSWDLAGSPDHPGKKVYGFSAWENFKKDSIKTSSKKVLRNWDKLSPQEQQAVRDAMGEHEIKYLSDKPLGQGWEGSAYPVLTKDLGEAVRKNFNGCFGEPDHLGRMLELSHNGEDKPKLKEVWDLYRSGDFEKAYELYTKGNPRRMMKNRLNQRLNVLLNPDNADLFAALSKAQPRKTREMIGGGRRSSEKGPGAIVMEKLDIPANGQEEFSEADFIAMNSDLASRILKAHVGNSAAFGTDFPEHFEPGNGKIGPNMRFHPVLRGIDGELYRIKDIRNVFDSSVLPPDRESAFHNLGFDKNHKLKIYDFDSDPNKV